MKIIAHAHQSAHPERPQNSLQAFERAFEIGVDAIEADLLMTKDRRLVARHDDFIRSDGAWSYVHELTLAELQRIDLGAGERIPSIEQVFERFETRCPMVLEPKAFGIATPLVAFLRKHKAHRRVHVTSFLHTEIAEIGRLDPEIERSIVLAAMPVNLERILADAGARQVSLFRGYLDEAEIRRLRDLDIRVWAYPVNHLPEARQFAAWGVDAIFTDDPAAMKSLRGDG